MITYSLITTIDQRVEMLSNQWIKFFIIINSIKLNYLLFITFHIFIHWFDTTIGQRVEMLSNQWIQIIIIK